MESCIKTLEIEIFLTGRKFRQGGCHDVINRIVIRSNIGIEIK